MMNNAVSFTAVINRVSLSLFVLLLLLVVLGRSAGSHASPKEKLRGHIGFDRNDYPGDDAMAQLRKQFEFVGFWLTPPPLEKKNTWIGKREVLLSQGYGFALLARGPAANAIRNTMIAGRDGAAAARQAAQMAVAEGFAAGGILFVDVEDGGRLAPAYHAYLKAWADEIVKSGFKPGVYCSGIAVDEGGGVAVVTADDIRANEAPRQFAFWVFNDACPPSPGCVLVANPPLPSVSGVEDATIWQFVRSPRVKETASRCSGYAGDENCYATLDAARKWHLDMNTAATANPSYAPN